MTNLNAMRVAVRVLAAATHWRKPYPADVAKLRAYLGVDGTEVEAEELACDVIRTALQRRQESRAERLLKGANRRKLSKPSQATDSDSQRL
jgi:hypothetical protein